MSLAYLRPYSLVKIVAVRFWLRSGDYTYSPMIKTGGEKSGTKIPMPTSLISMRAHFSLQSLIAVGQRHFWSKPKTPPAQEMQHGARDITGKSVVLLTCVRASNKLELRRSR